MFLQGRTRIPSTPSSAILTIPNRVGSLRPVLPTDLMEIVWCLNHSDESREEKALRFPFAVLNCYALSNPFHLYQDAFCVGLALGADLLGVSSSWSFQAIVQVYCFS